MHLSAGLVGAGIAAAGTGSVHASGVERSFYSMVISPIIGLITALFLALLIMRAFRKRIPLK